MNIVELVKSQMGDDLVGAAAGVLGLGADRTRSAMSAAVPAVLAGILGSTSTKEGREALGSALDRQEPGWLDQLSTTLSGGGQQSLIGSGVQTLSGLLGGGRLTGLSKGLGSFAGIGEGSAKSLIGLIAPVVMGVLGREQRARNLDTDGLVSMLQSQKSEIASAMPAGLASSLSSMGLLEGFGDTAHAAPRAAATAHTAAPARVERAAPPPRERHTGRNWGLIAAAIIGLAALGWALTRSPEQDAEVAEAPRAQPEQSARTQVGTTAEPAATMVVGDVDVGRQFSVITNRISQTMNTVRDGATAEAALPQLSELNAQLDDLAPLVDRLPAEAKPAFSALAREEVADVQDEVARIAAMPNVPEAVIQTVTDMTDKLEEMMA